jgi:hypothetical protein
MGQVYQCWWRMCWEINVFWFEYHMFYILYPFVTELVILPRISLWEGYINWVIQSKYFYLLLFVGKCVDKW